MVGYKFVCFYLRSIIFFVCIYAPDLKTYKYTPLGSAFALKLIKKFPADIYSLIIVANSFPAISYIFKVVLLPAGNL